MSSEPVQSVTLFDLSRDMLEGLVKVFDSGADENGIATVEVNDHGLWLHTPFEVAVFLGKARFASDEVLPDYRAGIIKVEE